MAILTLGVFLDVDSSHHYSVQLSQHLHHLAHLATIIPSDYFDSITPYDCPVAEGLLQALAHVFFRQMVGPFGLVETSSQPV